MDVLEGRSPIGGLRPGIAGLLESGIVELVNYGRERDGLIPLWVGEGDLPTARYITAAASRGLEAGHTFYTYQRGIPALRSAVAAYLTRHYGVPVGMERILITGGGMQAIMLTLQALLDPGDELVVATPVWPNIMQAAEVIGGRLRPVPMDLHPDRGWTVDLDRMFDTVGPRCKALFVNSPGNPTGTVLHRDALLAIRDFARRRGLWVISDEVYGRLCYAGRPRQPAPSFLEIMDPEERLVVVNSFSKNWAMTGWRVGWATAPASLGQVYENLIQYNLSGVAEFMQEAALTAVTQGEDHVAALIDRCRAGRDLVCDRLSTMPRVRFARPEGAFYLFFEVDGEDDSRVLAKRLVDQANVGLAPGSAFGPGGQRALRLCFAGSEGRLTEAMDRLQPVLS